MSKLCTREMTEADLPGVDAVQHRAYGAALHEPLAVLQARLRLYPAGCRVAVDGGAVAAYLFSHPWAGMTPPPLSAVLTALPSTPDCYYLHDLAVDPAHRGFGVGDRLAGEVLSFASRAGFSRILLVAVQASRLFWQRLGFRAAPLDDPATSKLRASYGEDACLMLAGSWVETSESSASSGR